MFGNDNFAKIKKVIERKEYFTVCQISTSSKNKKTDKYECDFMSYVNFVGEAHKQKPEEGQRIQIISCGVKNCYLKDNNLKFLTSPQYSVFDYILMSDDNKNSKKSELLNELASDNDELPF